MHLLSAIPNGDMVEYVPRSAGILTSMPRLEYGEPRRAARARSWSGARRSGGATPPGRLERDSWLSHVAPLFLGAACRRIEECPGPFGGATMRGPCGAAWVRSGPGRPGPAFPQPGPRTQELAPRCSRSGRGRGPRVRPSTSVLHREPASQPVSNPTSTNVANMAIHGPSLARVPVSAWAPSVQLAIIYIKYSKYINQCGSYAQPAVYPARGAEWGRCDAHQQDASPLFFPKTSWIGPGSWRGRRRRRSIPVSLQIVLRALVEEGLRRDNDPALLANIEGQAKAVRHLRTVARQGRRVEEKRGIHQREPGRDRSGASGRGTGSEEGVGANGGSPGVVRPEGLRSRPLRRGPGGDEGRGRWKDVRPAPAW